MAGVEWGLVQALAVGAPGSCSSVCVIAKALQLAEVHEGVYQQIWRGRSSGGHVQGSGKQVQRRRWVH